ncbi:hypothetical protein HKCCE3408_05500 [Rhodobacterales bacterium HKCCE3408]|nr:hypothetical protein [Rhodobacterales bacterium HKCCE3408]
MAKAVTKDKTGPDGPEDDMAESDAAGAPQAVIKRGDILDAMAARSALKRGDLKTVLDLALDEIGRALDSGNDLILPPLGRVRLVKRKPGTVEVMTLRLRRKPAGSDDAPAEEAETEAVEA